MLEVKLKPVIPSAARKRRAATRRPMVAPLLRSSLTLLTDTPMSTNSMSVAASMATLKPAIVVLAPLPPLLAPPPLIVLALGTRTTKRHKRSAELLEQVKDMMEVIQVHLYIYKA